MVEPEEPNFKKAKDISPASAGVIVDWSIGAREITATIVDLVVKKNLLIEGDKVYLSNKSFDREFEKYFVNEIFDGKKELKFQEISSIAYDTKSENLIKIISRGLIEEGLIRKDFQKVLARNIKESLKKMSPEDYSGPQSRLRSHIRGSQIRGKKVKALKPRTLKILLWGYLILMFLSAFLDFLRPIVALLFIPALIFFWIYYMVKKLTPKMEILLTEKGKEAQREMKTLKKFIETHPLYEDRLANILVGHAIAFGVGKSWMKRLGKKNTSLLKLTERLESESDTMGYLIDYDTYIKEFYD
jgi:hypothetical protein